MPPSTLADPRGELPPAARRWLVAGVVALHAAAAWALLQVPSVRHAIADAAPLMVDLVAATPAPPARAPEPPPPVRRAPARVVATSAPPAPAPAFVAPPPVDTPAAPAAAAQAPAEAPAAPPPAPPASSPKTIPPTAVQYLVPPAPVYPERSRRLGESGRVLVRVEIDAAGHARQAQLQRSSGHERLDDAALAAVRAARFKPYTDNGVPIPVWTTVPIVFELEN